MSLERFIDAQSAVWANVLDELRSGHKRSHWMWFVFPQLKGLGNSSTAEYYGIAGLTEAHEYLAHPLLGARLEECVDILLSLSERDPSVIFGYPDDLKLRSCLTLFDEASTDEENPYREALDGFFNGQGCARTRQIFQQS